ncbi:hypothetical protein SAY86_029737 [Trapa natans]|uniref:E3 ubiquitin-protein ligase RMA n=1 Tax=Trapa natans TaxID=22666 RepID=A0AAN7M1Q2_TRANT|nr:hypothetical protein SAY86_029737 [Trapa natans]
MEHPTQEVLSNNPVCCKTADWKSILAVAAAASLEESYQPTDFECNICLDTVQDPVVTLCGHLYCWPCIYRWLQVQRAASEEAQPPQPHQCPVCKADISTSTLVPLYGQGRAAAVSSCSKPSKSKEHAKHLGGIVIPRRPPACSFDSPRTPGRAGTQVHNDPTTYYPSQPRHHRGAYGDPASPTVSFGGTAAGVIDPLVAMIGEMGLARVSGGPAAAEAIFQSYPNSYHVATGRSLSPRLRRHVMQAERSLGRISFFLFCCAFLCLLLF